MSAGPLSPLVIIDTKSRRLTAAQRETLVDAVAQDIRSEAFDPTIVKPRDGI
jgi:hypothetical protein